MTREFSSSKKRQNWIKNGSYNTRKYLKRKGITDSEDQIQHCLRYLKFLTGVKQTRKDFSWFKFLTLNDGFRNVFAYYTKEVVGWEEATVPKENYKDLFE